MEEEIANRITQRDCSNCLIISISKVKTSRSTNQNNSIVVLFRYFFSHGNVT